MSNIPIETKRAFRLRISKCLDDLKSEFNLPKNSRIVVSNEHDYFDIDVVCSGAKFNLGYHCGRYPNHSGKCYSLEKSMDFNPENL